MKIAISVETTVDMQEDLLKKFNIFTVPFSVLLGDEEKKDGEVSVDEIIEFVNSTKTLPKTSAVNEFQYEEHFNNILKDYDAIIHFSLSSKISSAYSNAERVSKKMNNVYVIDTLSLSTGIALLTLYARKLIDSGLDAKSIYEKCLKRVPYVQASFVLSRLDYLYKGGRCSALALFGSNILKIRPQIIVTEGKMISGKKYRGSYDSAVYRYVEDTLNEFNNPDLENVFITYTTFDEQIIEKTKSILTTFGFKNIYVTRANATITSHCGENCFGILYINDGDLAKNNY